MRALLELLDARRREQPLSNRLRTLQRSPSRNRVRRDNRRRRKLKMLTRLIPESPAFLGVRQLVYPEARRAAAFSRRSLLRLGAAPCGFQRAGFDFSLASCPRRIPRNTTQIVIHVLFHSPLSSFSFPS